MSEEKKAETDRSEAAAGSAEKSRIGRILCSASGLGQEPDLNTVKAKALYLTANVAGFDFNREDVQYYADYIRAISGESGKSADTDRMGEINKLEMAL